MHVACHSPSAFTSWAGHASDSQPTCPLLVFSMFASLLSYFSCIKKAAHEPFSPGRESFGCEFCGVSVERGFRITYEVCARSFQAYCSFFSATADPCAIQDADFVVFLDHKPAAPHHLLVTPKKHIGTCRLGHIVFTSPPVHSHPFIPPLSKSKHKGFA